MKKFVLPSLLVMMVLLPNPSPALNLPVDAVTDDCLEGVPAKVSPTAISPVNVDVALLADRAVTTARAQTILNRAATAYAPLGITLRASSVQKVTFTGATASELFAQSKAKFGGTRPAGSDMVALITSVNFDADVVGQADCIGGVRFPANAFLIAEDTAITFNTPDSGYSIGPVSYYVDIAGKTLAHEAGHLLGAHHHYANCAEARPPVGQIAPCTVMFNVVDTMSLTFGTLEAAVVKGHADAYARP